MKSIDFYGMRSTIPNIIIIPESFYEYIVSTVNKLTINVEDDDGDYYDIDHDVLYKSLSDMLFVKY